MIDKIPNERLSLLSYIFMSIRNSFRNNISNGLFAVNVSDLASYCAEEMIQRLPANEDRFEVYKKVLLNATNDTLDDIAYEIIKIEIYYGRFTDRPEKEEKQLISIRQLEILEDIFLKRIRELSESGELISIVESLNTLYLWEDLDEINAKKHLLKILSDDENKLRFICKFAGRWSGTLGEGGFFS